MRLQNAAVRAQDAEARIAALEAEARAEARRHEANAAAAATAARTAEREREAAEALRGKLQEALASAREACKVRVAGSWCGGVLQGVLGLGFLNIKPCKGHPA